MNKTEVELEIFRAGKHTDANGTEVTIENEDIDKIITSYNTELHEAPLVIGHPQHDKPAWGWVSSLRRRGKLLIAKLTNIAPEISQAVRKGQYKKVSASFYRPNAEQNPTTNSWYLRHIGLLGAQTPAVKGLSPLKFSDAELEGDSKNTALFYRNKASILPFSRQYEFNEQEQELEQSNAKEWQAIVEFVDKQIACGKILPHKREQTITFIASLDSQDILHSRELEKNTNPRLWFCNFIEAQPQQINFSACSNEEANSEKEKLAFNNNGVAIGEKASAYMQACAEKGQVVSAAQAVKYVTKNL